MLATACSSVAVAGYPSSAAGDRTRERDGAPHLRHCTRGHRHPGAVPARRGSTTASGGTPADAAATRRGCAGRSKPGARLAIWCTRHSTITNPSKFGGPHPGSSSSRSSEVTPLDPPPTSSPCATASRPMGSACGQRTLPSSREECPLSEAEIRQVRDGLLRMGSLWVPPGAVALRGAVDFRTAPGWDTVFTGVLNQAQPPPLSSLTGRVETDWYAFDTEFRYVLQVGDVLSGSGRIPVGQAFAVPRVEHGAAPGRRGGDRRVPRSAARIQ